MSDDSPKAHILFVEDDRSIRQLVTRVLERANYQVTAVADGQSAIVLLSEDSAETYDLVLTDIVMGDIDGIEVMHIARQRTPPPEVILLTGHGSMETAIAAVRTGAFDYLLKPCNLDILLERIDAALTHHQQYLSQARKAQAWSKIAKLVQEGGDDPLGDPALAIGHPDDVGVSVVTAVSGAAPAAERFLRVGALTIDLHRREVWSGDESIHVTPTEYTFLVCLARTPERVVSYVDIARQTHTPAIQEDEAHELLRWHVRNLRNKLDRRYIVSVRSTGYMLVNPNKESQERELAEEE